MLNVRLACDHLFGKLLFAWLSLVMSMMVSFVLSFFPRDVLDEILNLIESVSEDFPSYSYREGISLYTTHNFATQIERYNELSEDQKIIVDSIKQICNTFPTAFFWHNGHADDQCQFIGLHIHLLIGSKEQLSQIYR